MDHMCSHTQAAPVKKAAPIKLFIKQLRSLSNPQSNLIKTILKIPLITTTRSKCASF